MSVIIKVKETKDKFGGVRFSLDKDSAEAFVAAYVAEFSACMEAVVSGQPAPVGSGCSDVIFEEQRSGVQIQDPLAFYSVLTSVCGTGMPHGFDKSFPIFFPNSDASQIGKPIMFREAQPEPIDLQAWWNGEPSQHYYATIYPVFLYAWMDPQFALFLVKTLLSKSPSGQLFQPFTGFAPFKVDFEISGTTPAGAKMGKMDNDSYKKISEHLSRWFFKMGKVTDNGVIKHSKIPLEYAMVCLANNSRFSTTVNLMVGTVNSYLNNGKLRVQRYSIMSPEVHVPDESDFSILNQVVDDSTTPAGAFVLWWMFQMTGKDPSVIGEGELMADMKKFWTCGLVDYLTNINTPNKEKPYSKGVFDPTVLVEI